MINWIIWFWALLCPNSNHTLENHGDCTLIHYSTNSLDDEEDSGGETGNFPPFPPPPPPPPPPRG